MTRFVYLDMYQFLIVHAYQWIFVQIKKMQENKLNKIGHQSKQVLPFYLIYLSGVPCVSVILSSKNCSKMCLGGATRTFSLQCSYTASLRELITLLLSSRMRLSFRYKTGMRCLQ